MGRIISENLQNWKIFPQIIIAIEFILYFVLKMVTYFRGGMDQQMYPQIILVPILILLYDNYDNYG